MKDGGQAFPRSSAAFNAQIGDGMSLRDWFAGMALQGLVISVNSNELRAQILIADAEQHGETVEESQAAQAYELADAMLAEREKERS